MAHFSDKRVCKHLTGNESKSRMKRLVFDRSRIPSHISECYSEPDEDIDWDDVLFNDSISDHEQVFISLYNFCVFTLIEKRR